MNFCKDENEVAPGAIIGAGEDRRTAEWNDKKKSSNDCE